MKPNPSKIVIPIVVFVIAVGANVFTTVDSAWYRALAKPAFAPPGSFIGAVWTTIYVLTAISAVRFWSGYPKDRRFNLIAGTFVLNAILNAAWSFIFFTAHRLGLAVLDAAAIALTALMLVVLLWKRHRASAYLLIPYLAWTSFATYLAYAIWRLNA